MIFLKSNKTFSHIDLKEYSEWLKVIGVLDEDDFAQKHRGTQLKIICKREQDAFRVKLIKGESEAVLKLLDYPFSKISSLLQKKDDLYKFGSLVSFFINKNKLNCSGYDFREYFYNEYVKLMKQYND